MVFIGYEYTNDQVKWKKIYWMNGEETKYSISNIGLVRNDKKDKILKMREYKGYLRVGLTHNGKQKEFLIHRLVAIAFIPNPENKPEVNHINGVKSCNYDYNLEWVTRTENQIHAVKNGLIDYKNSKNGKNISEEKIQKICKLIITIYYCYFKLNFITQSVNNLIFTHNSLPHFHINNIRTKSKLKYSIIGNVNKIIV